jgi:hypothetical protein
MTTFNVQYGGRAVPLLNPAPCHEAIWGGGSMCPHIHLGTRQTKCGCLTAPATSPEVVPHELEVGRTSEAPSTLWTPQKFVPLPEF